MGSGHDLMLLIDVELMFEKCDWKTSQAGERKERSHGQ